MTLLLETPEARTRWTGSREIVRLDQLVCPNCETMYTDTFIQPAILRAGGYGASERITVRFCECGHIRLTTRETINPRRHDDG